MSALGKRARAARVPWSTLEGVAAACPGRPADRFAAMQVYALLRHAIIWGHVRPVTAAALERHVLPAIVSGRLRVEAPADPTSGRSSAGSAAYFFEANTLRLGVCPVDLDDVLQASVIVHEAQHAVQDGERRRGTLLEFERDAYTVAADYMLRASGAVVPQPGGTRLDVAPLQDLLTHTMDPVELERLESSFREHAFANLRAGRPELNGPLLSDATTPEALDRATHLQFPYPAARSFDAGYIDVLLGQAQGRDRAVTPEDVVARLGRPYGKNGLDAAARPAPRG